MTVIVSQYTPEGIVIGADGMRKDCNTKSVESLTARKLFSAESRDVISAYGWAGATALYFADRLPFSFVEASQSTVRTMRREYCGFPAYVENFAKAIYKKILEHCGGNLNPTPAWFLDGELARVLFVGYERDLPLQMEVIFRNKGGMVIQPEVSKPRRPSKDLKIFSGSNDVWLRLQDSMFAPSTIKDGVEIVRTYIQACSDHCDVYFDCQGVGGHIHIGVITPKGFDWSIPPYGCER